LGVLEWLGAHLLGPIISLYKAVNSRPRPQLKIHKLVPSGGGTHIDFYVVVQNVGTQSTQATVTARVDDIPVQVVTPTVELIPNAPSTTVQIHVPRPTLGELVKAFNSETTLYGRTLTVELADEKRRERISWHEHVYTPEENRERHEIQAREWRIGRGEATDQDHRADKMADLLRRHYERRD
jgi:hypothetical protein